MLTRRDFLKGLLTTIAATAITRNGVLRPPEELETPERTIFDMAQNTWLQQQNILPDTYGFWFVFDNGCLLGRDWSNVDFSICNDPFQAVGYRLFHLWKSSFDQDVPRILCHIFNHCHSHGSG